MKNHRLESAQAGHDTSKAALEGATAQREAAERALEDARASEASAIEVHAAYIGELATRATEKPILCEHPGTVEFAGPHEIGLLVHVMGEDGQRYQYTHLSHLSVSEGDTVSKGQPIGWR